MEIGDSATRFKLKHESIDDELRGCQRYYYRWNATSVNKAFPGSVAITNNSGTTRVDTTFALPSTMRATPSFQWNGDVASFKYYAMGFSFGIYGDGWALYESDNETVTLRNTLNSSSSFGSEIAGLKLAANNSTSGWLEFNAQLQEE